MADAIRIRPWSIKAAKPFVLEVHRRLPDMTGALFATRICIGDETVGSAVVGRTAARLLHADYGTLEVIRVAVNDAVPNGCSRLYGACARAAQALGADNLVTYTHLDEPGVSLKASGWIEDGTTSGGEHARASRPRKAAADPLPKRRWWAPFSRRAQELIALRAHLKVTN